jgi:hypothetical protein
MIVPAPTVTEPKGATGEGMIVPVTRVYSDETKRATGEGMIVPVIPNTERPYDRP